MKLLVAFEFQDHDAHIAAHMAFMATRMVQINPQVYALMQSHISDHISFKARAEVQAMMAQDPQMMEMQQADPQQFYHASSFLRGYSASFCNCQDLSLFLLNKNY